MKKISRLWFFLLGFVLAGAIWLLVIYRFYTITTASLLIVMWLAAVGIGNEGNFGINHSYWRQADYADYVTDRGSEVGAVCLGVIFSPAALLVGRLAILAIFHR